MLVAASLPLLVSAAVAMGKVHLGQSPARSHSALVIGLKDTGLSMRRDIDKRDSFTNAPITWYPTDTGPDACTGKNHQSSDWVVAMNPSQFGGGSGCCGKQLKIDYNGKSAVATCVDECSAGACTAFGGLDLTEGLFEYFVGDPGIGTFFASWSFVDGSGSGGGDDSGTTTTSTTTTKHTTTSTKTSTTTTSTKTSTSTSSTTTTHTSTTASSSAAPRSSSSPLPSSSAPAPSSTPSAPAAAATPTAAGPENVGQFNEAVLNLLQLVVQAAAPGE